MTYVVYIVINGFVWGSDDSLDTVDRYLVYAVSVDSVVASTDAMDDKGDVQAMEIVSDKVKSNEQL